MRREDHLWRERHQLLDELRRHDPRGAAAESGQLLDALRIVRLLEDHRVKVRRVLDELEVALDVNFPIPARRVVEHIDAAHLILGPQRAPRLFERDRRLEMPRASGDRGNENLHGGSKHQTPNFKQQRNSKTTNTRLQTPNSTRTVAT